MKLSNFLVFLSLIILLGCSTKPSYKISDYWSKEEADSIKVNLVTLIGVKPKSTNWQTRLLPEHREYYKAHAERFHWIAYSVSEDSVHYYYMIRPARHMKGNIRGTGGYFKLDDSLNIIELHETFVTHVMSDSNQVREKGFPAFLEMIQTGSIGTFKDSSDLIEWPDERLKYDNQKNEWRYDVEE